MTTSSQHGRPLIAITWWVTAIFAVTALIAVASKAARPVAAAVALALFTVGCTMFLWAYAIAVRRSRADTIGVGGLYFLSGDVAPAAVRRSLLGALAVQGLIGLGTALARPFTSLAFGVLTPVFGLAACGLWGARHGHFAPRPGAVATRIEPADDAQGPSEEGDRSNPPAADAEPAPTASGDGPNARSTHEPPEIEQNAGHG